jgi:hypothetical protein
MKQRNAHAKLGTMKIVGEEAREGIQRGRSAMKNSLKRDSTVKKNGENDEKHRPARTPKQHCNKGLSMPQQQN